jgi:hypothetical protein
MGLGAQHTETQERQDDADKDRAPQNPFHDATIPLVASLPASSSHN